MHAKRHVASKRRRHLRHRAGDAVIGRLGDDDARASRVIARDPKREIRSLAAGAGEHDVGQLGGKCRDQFLRVSQDQLVEIAGVRIERRRLLRDSRHHVRMTVPDRRHVVVDVEITVALRVEHPHALCADEMQRLLIKQLVRRAEDTLPAREQRSQRRIELLGRGGVERIDHQRL